jgi:multisubunit Na+/H+ antiporter MnhG subunit
MSVQSLLTATAVAAALLGCWGVVRFPDFGPRTLTGATLNVCAALAANAFAPPLVAAVARGSTDGPYLALFGLVLPALCYAFWAGGCLIRVAQQALSSQRF